MRLLSSKFHTHAHRHISLFFNREQTAKIGFYKTDPVSVDPVLKRKKLLKTNLARVTSLWC